MRFLVIGCNGMLGRRVVEAFSESPMNSVRGLDLPDIDIADPAGVNRALTGDVDWVINCAAYTDVDGAEDDTRAAFRANAEGPAVLAEALDHRAARIVHISTDYVFDGTKAGSYSEDDEPNPIGVYARSKLAGERALSALGPRSTVVRTAWLYGPGGRNFFSTILMLARERGELSVVNDQHGSPTYTVDLARAIRMLVERGLAGTFNVTNSGSTTWHGAAGAACEIAGIRVPIRPISSPQLGRKAPRPANSVLDTGKFEAATGHRMRHWREALEEYLSMAI